MGKYKELNFSKGNILQYSSNISCEWKKEQTELEIYMGRDAHNIPYATCNVQTDYADFESIAFCVWAKCPDCKVILRYEPLKWYTEKENVFPLDYEHYDECLEWIAEEKERRKKEGKKLNDSIGSRIQHYMRFLYRVMKMKELYGEKFFVDENHSEEVEIFTKEFQKRITDKSFKMTKPTQKGGAKETKNVSENHLEKWFMYYSATPMMKEKCPELVNSKSGNMKLYDQFPCGLFAGSPSEKNRIFNRGAFDLWGMDKENHICLYELKEYKNAGHLGIISELFFYSCLISDLKKVAEFLSDEEKSKCEFRGFQEFLRANNKITAYFLVPRFHSFIKENLSEILREMNQRNDNVQYDAIVFDQDKIVGEDTEAFLKELRNLISD